MRKTEVASGTVLFPAQHVASRDLYSFPSRNPGSLWTNIMETRSVPSLSLSWLSLHSRPTHKQEEETA